jgi:hypothetical protein
VEDYIYFIGKAAACLSNCFTCSNKELFDSNVVVVQEDFSGKEALELGEFKKFSKTKKFTKKSNLKKQQIEKKYLLVK